MPIAKDQVVTIHYRVEDDDGNLIDTSAERDPLAYLHGHPGIIPGLQEELEGREEGEKVECVVGPEKAYGTYDPQLDLLVDKEQFPEEHRDELAPGVQFQGPHPEDQDHPQLYTIKHLEGENVYVTGNHELAGRTLHFQVEVVETRDASPEELAHGHPHGPDGHAH